jgi:DNA-binding GntR family transcriptional regulator
MDPRLLGAEPLEATTPVREDRITEAYLILRDLIVRGHIAPGTRLVVSDVAARLGISRIPVSSALQRLLQEGYVLDLESGRQARLMVAPLTVEDARELFSIVAKVEGLAARQAAELPRGGREDLARALREINVELLEAASAPQPDTNLVFELDVAFHGTYARAGAGPRLRALHQSVKPQVERYNRIYTTFLVGEIHTSVEEHEQIATCIEVGDVSGADAAAERNFRNAADRLSKVIHRLGERGAW